MVIQQHNGHLVEHNEQNWGTSLEGVTKLNEIISKINFYVGLLGLIALGTVLLPVILFVIWNLTRQTRNLYKEAKREKESINLKTIQSELTFEELNKWEDIIKKLISKVDLLVAKAPVESFLFKRIITNLNLFRNEMLEIKEILGKSSVYSTEDLGLTPEQLTEYMEQFKGMEDLWGYETTKEDKEVVFNHKQQLQSA